jgi:DNA-directed RNA polymerase specialized sigma24 family protein
MPASEPGPVASRREHRPAAARPRDLAQLAGIRAGFIDFYDREYRRVVVFLMSNGAVRQAAEDAAQEAFTDAWALTGSGKWPQVTNPPAWIRAVALRKYRRPAGPRVRPMTVPVPGFADTADPGDGLAELTAGTLAVHRALRDLPAGPRAALAFQLDGFTGPETAEQLGITAQQVRDWRKKARKILSRKLAADREGGSDSDREPRR